MLEFRNIEFLVTKTQIFFFDVLAEKKVLFFDSMIRNSSSTQALSYLRQYLSIHAGIVLYCEHIKVGRFLSHIGV